MNKRTCKKNTVKAAADSYAGADIDVADREKVDKQLIKERIRTENLNPRNNQD